MTIPLSGFSGGVVGECPEMCHGITTGDAIRYNPLTSYYTKSQGDVAQHAEVVGVVESIDADNNSVEVVLSGQIKYPLAKVINATHVDPDMDPDGTNIAGASGGNDIYFLSEITAGKLQNLAPATPSTIAKPIFQVAPDGNYTGQVTNYIGYQIGGNVSGEEEFSEPAGAQSNQLLFGGDDGLSLIENGWYNATIRRWFSLRIDDKDYSGDTFIKSYKTFGKRAGVRYKVTVECIDSALSTIIKKRATQKGPDGKVIGRYIVVDADRSTSVLWLEGVGTLQDSKKIHIGTSTYDISYSVITAFALPKVYSRNPVASYVDINNNAITVQEVLFLKVPADGKGLSVTLVPNATFNTITVRNQFDVGNSTHIVTDLTATVKEIADAVADLNIKINNTPASSEANKFQTRISRVE